MKPRQLPDTPAVRRALAAGLLLPVVLTTAPVLALRAGLEEKTERDLAEALSGPAPRDARGPAAGLEEGREQAARDLRSATGMPLDLAEEVVQAAQSALPELVGNPSGLLPTFVWNQALWIPGAVEFPRFNGSSIYIPLEGEPTGVRVYAVGDSQQYVVEWSGYKLEEIALWAAFHRATHALVAATRLPASWAGALLGLLVEHMVTASPQPIPLVDGVEEQWNVRLVLEQVDWAGAAIVSTEVLSGVSGPQSPQTTLWLPLKEAQGRQPGGMVVTGGDHNVIHRARVPYALLVGWGDYGSEVGLEFPPVTIHDEAIFAHSQAAVEAAVAAFRNRPGSDKASGLEEKRVEEEVREFGSVGEFIGTVTVHEAMQGYLSVWAEGAPGSRSGAVRVLDLPWAEAPADARTTVTVYTDAAAIEVPAVQALVAGWDRAGASSNLHFILRRYPDEGQPIETPATAFGVRPAAAGPYANLPTLTYKRLDDLRKPEIAALYAIAVNPRLAGQAIPMLAALGYYDDVLGQRRIAIFV